MPFEFEINNLPAGYAVSIAKPGEKVKVQVREFISSEDGDTFIERLEGLPANIINHIPEQNRIPVSQIDHLLAIIHPDKSVELYVNELKILTKTRVRNKKNAGDPIFQDDMVSIEGLEFENITVPRSAGIAFIFSVGWRKGFYYDFAPLHTPHEERQYDWEKQLGSYYAYLLDQNYFKISDDDWKKLFEQKWFPFIALKRETIKKILANIKAGDEVDNLLPHIQEELLTSVDSMIGRWEKSNYFIEHIPFITTATDRYKEGDYISAVSILFPRIEGVLRNLYGVPKKGLIQQDNLSAAVVEGRDIQDIYSVLLPHNFEIYLNEIYFANFVPGKQAELSRNSVGHGVASIDEYSLKGATLALLLLDQIYFLLPN